MKQPIELAVFKRELSNYRYYKKKIKGIMELRQMCYDMLSGVHGVDPSKEATSGGVKNLDFEYRLRDEISHHDKQIARYQARVTDIENVLNKVSNEVRDALLKSYADGKPIRKVARDMYLADTTLRYRMNEELKKALL